MGRLCYTSYISREERSAAETISNPDRSRVADHGRALAQGVGDRPAGAGGAARQARTGLQLGAHDKDGRAHVYAPAIERKDATRSEISHLVSRFFRDSHEDLVLNILEDRGLDAKELKRLKEMLAEGAKQ
jgi:hypothetical protein